jgi:hypothetical protein
MCPGNLLDSRMRMKNIERKEMSSDTLEKEK